MKDEILREMLESVRHRSLRDIIGLVILNLWIFVVCFGGSLFLYAFVVFQFQ